MPIVENAEIELEIFKIPDEQPFLTGPRSRTGITGSQDRNRGSFNSST